jgi:hypothetical protein
LTSSLEALIADPEKTFAYSELKYFTMWWDNQADEMKA